MEVSVPDVVDVWMLWDWIDGQFVRRCRRLIIDVVSRTTMWVLWRFRNARVFGDNKLAKDMFF